jgi:hypothetical protein
MPSEAPSEDAWSLFRMASTTVAKAHATVAAAGRAKTEAEVVALSRGLREAAEQLASAKAHAEAAESERHAASVVQRTSNESP